MPISLGGGHSSLPPVLGKAKAIGQTVTAMLVNAEQRGRNDIAGKPMMKDNGKQAQEMVLTVNVVESTMLCGKDDDLRSPEPHEVVRMILTGQSFASWIEWAAPEVGDIVMQRFETGQAYDGGSTVGPVLTTQAQIDAVPRNRTVGVYGPITFRKPESPKHDEWVAECERLHAELTAPAPIERTPLGQAAAVEYDEESF